MKEFLSTLFNPLEGICMGDIYSTAVYTYTIDYAPDYPEFFCINPLDPRTDHEHFTKEAHIKSNPRRCDFNVSVYRSFLFEMDSLDLKDQLRILRNSAIPFTSIVFSGGKSYHAILSVKEGIQLQPFNKDSILQYKNMWKRLEAKLNKEAISLGYKLPIGQTSFFDSSCKNPSRLSRFPGTLRNGNKLQELIMLEDSISLQNFKSLLETCPVVKSFIREHEVRPEKQIDNLDDFKAAMSDSLKRKLTFVDWACDHNMYPVLYRLSKWAIDETNVTKECFLEFLEEHTFPSLLKRGYPAWKIQTGIDHAFDSRRDQ